MDNYTYGVRNEDRLARWLRRRGYSTGYSPGSRGHTDIWADKGGRHLSIQAKAVSTGSARADDPDEALVLLQGRFPAAKESALVRSARRMRRIPAVALINGDYFWLFTIFDHEYDMLHHGWLPTRPAQRS